MGAVEAEYYVLNGGGEWRHRGRGKDDGRRVRKAARLGKGVGREGGG